MIRKIVFGVLALLVLSWGSYSLFFKPDPIVLPDVEPLNVEAAALKQLYGYRPGPFEVVSHKSLMVDGIEIALYYPNTEANMPLVMFSHGNFSDRLQYDRIIHHWVSHGYAVIAPDHLDAGGMVNGIWAMTIHGQDGVLKARPLDMTKVLDNLGMIEDMVPDLNGRIDLTRIVGAGHSFGAFVAQMMGGAEYLDPDSGKMLSSIDPRIKAVVAISPPGPMFDMIIEESWNNLKLPQIVTTGTWDVEPRFFPQWQLHKLSYDRAPAGENYLLVTEGADHYLGNLICRLDREEAPQHDALNMVLSATTAFLDAYVKEDLAALTYLNSDMLTATTGNFSTLTNR